MRVTQRQWWQVGMIMVWGMLIGVTTEAWAQWTVNFTWYPTSDPSAVGTSFAGQPTTFTASISGSPPSGLVQYLWKFKGCMLGTTCPHGQEMQSVEWTYPAPDALNKVLLEVRITPPGAPNYESRSTPALSVPVTAATYTITIIPSAGGTVFAGDGPDAEVEPPNGIVCTGTTDPTSPACRETYANQSAVALKAVPDDGWAFLGWTVDGQFTPADQPTMLVQAARGNRPGLNRAQGDQSNRAEFGSVNMTVDSNNDGNIDDQDDLVEEVSGKLIDYQNLAGRVPVHLKAALRADLGQTYSLELAASSGDSHIQVWETAAATEPLNLPHAYTLEALSDPVTVYVSGCQPNNCGPGEVKLEWRLLQQQADHTTKIRLFDTIYLLVMDVAHLEGKFRVIGYEQQAEYEMDLTEDTEGNETFFRTLGGMRLHMQALTLPGVAVDTYTWSADQGALYDGYGLGAAELTGAALTGAALTDVYWEGAAQPAPNATITLTLHLTGNPIPVVVTRTIRSRELSTPMKGDDVRMLQSVLRSFGVSHPPRSKLCRDTDKTYGYCGTPVTIDGDFGGGTETAVNRFRSRDELIVNGRVDLNALDSIQTHWNDYLAAFEIYHAFPKIDMTHGEFDAWLTGGSETLAATYQNQFVAEVDPQVPSQPLDPAQCTESRKRLIRAWIENEANVGHWGFQTDYRIVLGGRDNNGSIGFSQIQNLNKYGVTHGYDVFTSVNLYHPADNVKGFGLWGGEHGGRSFYHAFMSNDFNGCVHREATYPKLDSTYFSNDCYDVRATDKLAKGLVGYKQGPGVSNDAGNNVLYSESWPMMLRQYPKGGQGDTRVKTGINYALTIQNNPITGLNLSQRAWTWVKQVGAQEVACCTYTEADWLSGQSWSTKCQASCQ